MVLRARELRYERYCASNGNSEKFELQMGFEPTTLRDLIGRFNHSATGDSVVNKGEMWVYMVPLKSVLMLNPLLPRLNW